MFSILNIYLFPLLVLRAGFASCLLQFLFIAFLLLLKDDKICHNFLIRPKSSLKALFYLPGHDTTASAISWILYSLAENPEYQRKCQEEIDEIFSGRDSGDIEW